MIKERIRTTIKRKKVTPTDDVPFEQKTSIIPLHLMVVVVDHHQGNFFLEGFSELGVSLSLQLLGKGTAPEEIYAMLSTNVKKDIILAVIREPDLEMISNFVQTRFSVSKKAKGIAFTTKVNSLVGVLIYKFLTNSREFNLKVENKKENEL